LDRCQQKRPYLLLLQLGRNQDKMDFGHTLDVCQQQFKHYSRILANKKENSSPLYLKLSRGIVLDRDLLELASIGCDPNLFFGSVHFLLLKGKNHGLRRFYAGFGSRTDKGDPLPAFRSFCLQHRPELENLMRNRSVQTNEAGRCAVLYPAFQIVSDIGQGKPLALVDLGASAGLSLLWDYYAYDYGSVGFYGSKNAAVRVSCNLRGHAIPHLSSAFPPVSSRIGVDLSPVNLRMSDSALWLRALVWPEHRNRASVLERAIEVARNHPPKLIKGDIVKLLPRIVDEMPPECAPCIFCSFTFRQLPTASCRALFSIMRSHSTGTQLSFILLDSFGKDFATLYLIVFRNNRMSQPIRLGRCDLHGAWLRWSHQR